MSRVGAVTWTLLLLPILVEIPVALAWEQPTYNPIELTVSDLGATTCGTVAYPSGPVPVCSPLHSWMNASTVLGGVCLGVGGVLLRQLAVGGVRRWVFVTLLLVSALSWVGAAAVPVDVDLELHATVALPAFFTQALALMLVRRDAGSLLRWRRCALWIGILVLLATVATVVAQGLDLPLGLIERLALYPAVAWFIGVGLLTLADSPRAQSR